MIKRICKQCGKEFVISDGEVKFYNDKNLTLPRRCKKCRKKNKKGENSSQSKQISNRIYVFAAAIILFIIFFALFRNKSLFDTSLFYANQQSTQENYELESLEQENGIDYLDEDSIEQENSEFEGVEQVTDEIDGTDLENSVDESSIENTELDESSETIDETYYTFASLEKRGEHFIKHGTEFPYETAKEYEAGANRVINSSEALQKNEKEDGDLIYYIESTNEIVFLSTYGDIRTYFRPDDGIDYYNRQ